MTDRTPRVVLVLTFLAFIPLGLPDGMIGVAWPSIRATFGEPIDGLGWLFVTSTIGYIASSLATGAALRTLGIGGVLIASCVLSGACLFGYALAPTWLAMVAIGLLAGASSGAIDAGINTFAAERYSARKLNLLHAFYGLGTAVGPAVMTATLAAAFGWQTGYMFVAAGIFALALVFVATRHRWPPVAAMEHRASAVSLSTTLRKPTVRLSMAVFFLYVGLEAGVGAWLYSLLHEGRAVPMVAAGSAVSTYWLSLFGGRIAYALVPTHVPPRAVVAPCMAVAACAAALLVSNVADLGNIVAVVLLGASSGPIFPSMIAATPTRIGVEHTPNAVGVQIAVSGIGIASVPALAGVIADAVGLHALPAALLVCWLGLLAIYLMLDRLHDEPTSAGGADAHPAAGATDARRSARGAAG
jgi:fucose permease